MTTQGTLRIAILAHSTNPRGGVVHALALGDALCRLGHEAVVHAPDARGEGFFRPTLCATVPVPASPVGASLPEMVRIRAADYIRHFTRAGAARFDVYHAQDGISGNALATLKERGAIAAFARTVHHIDAFADPELGALQLRSIAAADELLTVSHLWCDELAVRLGRAATVVGNGVDRMLFVPEPDGREPGLRGRLRLGTGPVLLVVGGVEPRKNTLRVLEAFVQLRAVHPAAQLIIAGGASVLDHRDYQVRFRAALRASGLPGEAVIETGVVPQADMPALYRLADLLLFPSVKEGFGLAVLEAMASGLPVVVSKIAPFTEYLAEDDVVWCDPSSAASIANASVAALHPVLHRRLASSGLAAAARYDWRDTARAHLGAYERLSRRTDGPLRTGSLVDA